MALVIGHLYLALVHRSTRHALRGMVTGNVDRDWARRHHEKWVEANEREGPGASTSESSSKGEASL